MTIRRFAVALVLAGLGLVGLATPAFAHAELVGSNPAKDATVDRPPTQIQLTFNETVSPESITVSGPPGAQWTVGQIKVDGPVVTAQVIPSGPEGQYTINYRVLSDDGDPVTGIVAFTTKSAAIAITRTEPAPAGQGSNDEGKGLPAWVWVLAIVVLIGVGAVVGRWVSRRTSGTDER